MRLDPPITRLCPVIAVVALCLLATAPATAVDPASAIACQQGGLSFTTPAPPVPPNVTTNAECAWDIFAWNSFAAMNWPADPERRGFPNPDRSKTFTNPGEPGKAGVELVWETFKEKREVFRNDPNPKWNVQDIDYPDPPNLWHAFGGYCTPGEQKEAEDGAVQRQLVHLAKFHHQLDETVEVSGEALEPNEVLCQGHGADCNAHGQPVGPRVWKGKPLEAGARPVYYEVKVNYDFFSYVLGQDSKAPQPPIYDDHSAVTHAVLGEIQLPVRAAFTSADKTSPTTNPGVGKEAYSQAACLDVYSDPSAEVPCKIGSIHTKSAWVELADDDPTKYHTTRAIYYKEAPKVEIEKKKRRGPVIEVPAGEPQICKSLGTFAMVGLHIIQRVHIKTPDGNPTGGAFVFASWEHEEVVPDDGPSKYHYVNYEVVPQSADEDLTPYPALEYAIPVSRMLLEPQPPKLENCTLSQQQTCLVNDMAHEKLQGTVWENYRLIGTQFMPVRCKADSNEIAQPYYLANAAIETNQGLQQFQGLPSLQPRFHPPQWCQGVPGTDTCREDGLRLVPSHNAFGFDRHAKNLTFGRQPYNMGGCMGCHGVAQQNGYSFSFVLLGGQRGAGADIEATEDVPPPKLTHSSDLVIESELSSGWSELILGAQPVPALNAYEPRLLPRPRPGEKLQQWRLVPYYKTPAVAIFGGTYLVQNVELGEEGVLTAGQGLGDPVAIEPLLPRPGGIGPSGPLSQSWILIPQGKPSHRIFLLQNVSTGGVLAVENGSPRLGSPLITAAAGPEAAKGWTLHIPAPSSERTSAAGR